MEEGHDNSSQRHKSLQLSQSFDTRTGKLKAVYVKVRAGKAHRTVELADGNAFADYDRRGRLLGVELLGPCQVFDEAARKEPEPVARGLLTGPPLRFLERVNSNALRSDGEWEDIYAGRIGVFGPRK